MLTALEDVQLRCTSIWPQELLLLPDLCYFILSPRQVLLSVSAKPHSHSSVLTRETTWSEKAILHLSPAYADEPVSAQNA